MLEFICFIAPAFISLLQYRRITKDNSAYSLADVVRTVGFIALNNLLVFGTLLLFHIGKGNEYFYALDNAYFFVRILFIGLVVSVISPLIVKYCNKNLSIDISRDEKLSRKERRELKRAKKNAKNSKGIDKKFPKDDSKKKD